MYDELVKRLWECASGECFNCSQYTPTTNASVCQKELMKQAADAIEEILTNYDAATDIMKHQTEYIEELEASKPRWIPVTERLPEEDTDVLVVRKFLGVKGQVPPSTYVEIASRFGNDWCADSDEYKITRSKHTNPTHWMPLPEPPKEEAT